MRCARRRIRRRRLRVHTWRARRAVGRFEQCSSCQWWNVMKLRVLWEVNACTKMRACTLHAQPASDWWSWGELHERTNSPGTAPGWWIVANVCVVLLMFRVSNIYIYRESTKDAFCAFCASWRSKRTAPKETRVLDASQHTRCDCFLQKCSPDVRSRTDKLSVFDLPIFYRMRHRRDFFLQRNL